MVETQDEPYGLNESPEGGNTTMAALTHVLGLFTWLGPIVVYVATDDPFVKENAAKATNWQISFFLWIVISFALSFVLVGFIGFLLFPVLDLIFCIMAAVKASDGEAWDYPLTLDII